MMGVWEHSLQQTGTAHCSCWCAMNGPWGTLSTLRDPFLLFSGEGRQGMRQLRLQTFWSVPLLCRANTIMFSEREMDAHHYAKVLFLILLSVCFPVFCSVLIFRHQYVFYQREALSLNVGSQPVLLKHKYFRKPLYNILLLVIPVPWRPEGNDHIIT